MKKVTAPGVTYVVYAAEGATVTCPDRPDPLLTCAGGKPNHFTAPGAEVDISDDSATIEACRNIKIEVSGSGGSGGSGGGEWTDIRPLSNTWTGTNTFNGTVRFASGIDCMGAAYIRADLHKTIDSDTLTSTSVLNMGEADGRYALKGESGGDSGLTPEEVEKLSIYASAEGRNIPAAPQIITEIGHTYTVSATASAVVVTDANGEPRCTVPAGKQLSFVATTETTNLSATDCTITENFRAAAPVILSGGGSTGGGEPEGDYVLLAPEGHIVGGRLDNLTNANDLQYKRSSLTEWDIPLPSVTSLQEAFMGTKLTVWTVNLPQVLLLDNTFQGIPMIHATMYAPNATNLNCTFRFNSSMISIEGDFSNVTRAYETCAGNSKFSIFRAALPKLDWGQDMFKGCILNNESVLTICNSVPTWTSGSHKITLGIHTDHKYDPEVNAALKRLDPNYEPLNLPIDETTGEYIEITENKGWTLTVQWNGTATENAYPNPAATYSLRPPVAPVYAKRGEDSDGKPVLDWGHYVTNWEENGYMEFASLEEAREYFNIIE